MANNSSGARSVLYGKTIDHVLEQRVVLSDGTLAHFRPLDRNQANAAIAGDGIEARAYRAIPELGRRHADEIERRFPKVLRRVGGYNLDAFVDPSRPVDLTRIMIGSEGTLGFIVDAKIKLVPLPAQKSVLTIEFDQLLDALGATPAILKHGPSAVEVMDDFILSHAKSHPGARPATARDDQRRRIGAPLRGVLRRLDRRAEGAHDRRRARSAVTEAAANAAGDRSAEAAGDLELPRSGAGTFDGDEDRRQGDLVRRGHGRRPGEAARLHRAFHRHRAPAQHHRGRLRARLGRLPARQAGGESQDG